MSMMGELKFLELQMKQTGNGIHQTKYFNEHLKKFNLEDAKEMKTPCIQHVLDWTGNPIKWTTPNTE